MQERRLRRAASLVLCLGLLCAGPLVNAAAANPAGTEVTAAAAQPAGDAAARSPAAAEACPPKKAKPKGNLLRASAEQGLPIAILVIVVAFVLARLPKVKGLDHSAAFRRRRIYNWLPLGLTYAFLYMGRYNLKVSQDAFETMRDASGGPMMANADFSLIFMIGTIVYGVAFVFNGPLTDKFGGRRAILLSAAGACVANVAMGLAAMALLYDWPGARWIAGNFVLLFSVLYGVNMYFQSFGAVAVVKVNAPWFHVRERGVFGAIFGILISLGVYFAFDWGGLILEYFGLEWVFLAPAVLLGVFWLLDAAIVADSPGQAGLKDFDLGDASSDHSDKLGVLGVFKLMLRNPIIMTIALIEFCSGFFRQAIMQWYKTFASQTNETLGLVGFVYKNWGLLLCIAGILGGVMAGVISDRLFQSRRGPVSFFLYAAMLIGSGVMTFVYQQPLLGPLVIILSMAVIGVHGMLSGTASMDFGGRRNVGVAVGIIDGFVYMGTGMMSLLYGFLLPQQQLDECGRIVGPATQPDNWQAWPISMVVVALFGTLLATRVWSATPRPRSSSGH